MAVTKAIRIAGSTVAAVLSIGGTTAGVVEAALPNAQALNENKRVPIKLLTGDEIPEWWKKGSSVPPPARAIYQGVRNSGDWKCMLDPKNTSREECIHKNVYYMSKNHLGLTDAQAFKFEAWGKMQFDSRFLRR
ncbi:hypothetical protein MHLP_04020 [Candidatus Mycoplasma haematolamae str. Purdue]|uniref:Uncharacterized protein n=1 Tax=Mycoplasma haematolamae (strain Purdue) TaxID=1212765 RepID=I7CKF7_MYCHA|nr:hypothetical protein [Candidatus Mycoplasma haematolamae]AFO52384.1 hypothetical protein MHLP_04020 [Candidatus Mycoplasma haematolamae str. Purdue]